MCLFKRVCAVVKPHNILFVLNEIITATNHWPSLQDFPCKQRIPYSGCILRVKIFANLEKSALEEMFAV